MHKTSEELVCLGTDFMKFSIRFSEDDVRRISQHLTLLPVLPIQTPCTPCVGVFLFYDDQSFRSVSVGSTGHHIGEWNTTSKHPDFGIYQACPAT